MSNQGFDTFAVQDLVEEKGICEYNTELVKELLNKQWYVNPLKIYSP